MPGMRRGLSLRGREPRPGRLQPLLHFRERESMSKTLCDRIRHALTPDEKFIRRNDSADSLRGEIRVLESYLWDLLKEHEALQELLNLETTKTRWPANS